MNSTCGAEVLLDLGRVPVVEQPVGGEVLVDGVRTSVVAVGGAAGAGDAAGGVDDDARVVSIEAGVEQRRERQRRRRDVAAGRGDEPGALQLGAVQLGQAVHGLGEQLGLVVLEAVPARVQRRRPSAGNAADRSTTQPTLPTSCGASAMRASCGSPRNTTSRPSAARRVELLEHEVRVGDGQRRVQVGGQRAGLRVAGGEDELEVGMPAMRRSSSAPVYPDAPMMPTRDHDA